MDDVTIALLPGKRKYRPRKVCTIDGCDRPYQARGLCMWHYNQFKKAPDFIRVVRNVGTPEERFHRSYRKGEPDECWEWQEWIHPKGYGVLDLPGNKKVKAHRFSYEHYIGPVPRDIFVLHECDNRRCVNPSHLFLGDHGVNARDMVSKGRAPHHEGVAKLTWQMATTLRVLYARGQHSCFALAMIYGVSEETARSIVKGERYLTPPR